MSPAGPESTHLPGAFSLPGVVRALEAALGTAAPEGSGAIIGPYKLLQKLGEGGFGIVWMAEQHEPIRRRVALKIIKTGMDTEEVIARFEAERQALALMDHANIARVFDAGATTTGRPYFVMELVRGVAITRYCDNNRLPADARLRLFIALCKAVQHAHQKGIIHRDLKPSNILVTLHDGVPVPKIIDFGIAKAIDKQLTEKTLFTQFHAFMGTPAYTSPEQMEMSGLDIDTRSDIYSLGVLLYELLAGRPPFDPDALAKSGLDAMRRTVREVDPPRPSTRLGTLPEADRTSVAQQRSTDAGKLSLLLRGDLDWIAMRCLEKDRTRRYETASALATDVERHLAHEPVSARPPSQVYRIQKFVRRYRFGVAAVVTIAISIVGGLITSSLLWRNERVAHQRALTAEQQQADLRHKAEIARAQEVKRAARTALDLANRNLADGHVTDGLAWLVYAAKKDPLNHTLAPHLASALASHNFLLPRGAPFACESRVLAVRFARDGRSFFAGTEDGTFRVLDATTGALKRQFQVGGTVAVGGWQFARANDSVVGARLVDNTFAVFDLESGQPKFPAIRLDPSVFLPFSPRQVELSPDGRWIYANAVRKFWLWSASTGALRLHREVNPNSGFDFSPRGDLLAIATGNSVECWALPSCERMSTVISFRSPSDPPADSREVHFSPDGRRLAVFDTLTGGVFDQETGALLHSLPKRTDFFVPALMAFPANDRVFVRTQTQSGWWNLADDTFAPLPLPSDLFAVSFDATGQRGIASSHGGYVTVFEGRGNSIVAEPARRQNASYCAALSPNGIQGVTGTASGLVYRLGIGQGAARPLILPRNLSPSLPARFRAGEDASLLVLEGDRAKIIHVASGQEIAGGFRYPHSILYSPMHDTHPQIRPDLKFMVVRTETGEWQSWELGEKGIRAVPLQDAPDGDGYRSFSLKGDFVGIAVPGAGARVWHLRTGQPLGPAIEQVITSSAGISPRAEKIATGAPNGFARVYDIATGQPVMTLETRPIVPSRRFQFSPDGDRVTGLNDDGEIRIWNSDTGNVAGPIDRLMGAFTNAIFSPDGRWLARSSAKETRILDGRTGDRVGRDIPAGGKIVNFNSDGTRLATAEREGSAQVWDVPGGDPVTEPLRHQPFLANQPEFSPDGRFLKTENGCFYLWAIPPRVKDGETAPGWLLELATLCAGKVVNDDGQLVDDPGMIEQADQLRRKIMSLPADAPFVEWGRWLLDDRADRPIAPGFTITPAEADRLAKEARPAGRTAR